MAHHSTTRSSTGRPLGAAGFLAPGFLAPGFLAPGFLAPLVALGAAIVSTGCQVAPAATPEHGEMLFSNYCAPCHGPTAEGKPEIGAPAIAGLPLWYVDRQLDNYRAGVRGTHFDDIEGMRMRPMSLTLTTAIDVAAVSTFVASLPPAPGAPTVQGDAEAGKLTYTTVCVACHFPTGEGMEPPNEAAQASMGPTLLVQPDWYLVKQLDKFHAGIRGSDAKRDAGHLMRTQLLTHVEQQTKEPKYAGMSSEQVIDPLSADVVAYIQTLRK